MSHSTMIRHIVMFTAKTPENIEPMYEGLKMLEAIEGDWSLSVTKNSKVDQIANDVDVVVYAEFPNQEALQKYKAHPAYENCIKVVRPLRDQRIAVDVPA